MPNIDYGAILGSLKDAVFGTVKEDAKQFLDQNKDARDFVEERAKRLLELGEDYIKASTDDERDSIVERMAVVKQSIRTQLAGVALSASEESRATFARILETAVGIMIKAIPLILAAV